MQNFQKYKEMVLYGLLILLCSIFLISKIVPKVINVVKLEMDIKEKNKQAEALLADIAKYEEYESIKKTSLTKLKKIYTLDDPADTVENSFVFMLDDIINITKYNNVKIYSIQYSYNPTDDDFITKGQDKYDACRVDLELVSDYQNFVSMLVELVKYPYFLKINSFKIIPYIKDKKILLIELKLTLYVERNDKSPARPQPVASDVGQDRQANQNGGAPDASTPTQVPTP